jgi:hypothetical protein
MVAKIIAERAEAQKLREETFQLALKKKEVGKRADAPVPAFLFGIFQNCGAFYTEAKTWYKAAQLAYEAGNVSAGNSYLSQGDAAMAKGDSCMSFW